MSRAARRSKPRPDGADAASGGNAARIAGILLFAAVTWLVFGPALNGPFVSDDQHYVERNPYVHELSVETVWAVVQPFGPGSRTVENWAPVNILMHNFAWQAFGDDVRGHHAYQMVLHLLVTLLLIPVLQRFGLSRRASWIGAALFLVHPANTEVAAWISQVKTTSAFALALLALLAQPKRPLLGALLFALALLAKPIATFALAVVVTRAWLVTRGEAADDAVQLEARRWPWLALWVLVFAAFAAVELQVFDTHASGSLELVEKDPFTRLRSAVALVARYALMAASGLGTSTFHDPTPVRSWIDPWFLSGTLLGLLCATRAAWTLLTRRAEALFWVWAGAAYVPVSQIFPFPFPMADRYLYFVLPGLYGALVCLGTDVLARVAGSRGEALRRAAPQVGLAAGVALALLFAVQSHARARIWSSRALILADAAANYPQGKSAAMLRARQAAMQGDATRAIAELRPLVRGGYNRFDVLLSDGAYAAVRDDPRFRALLREMAGWWIARIGELETLTQPDLYMLALSHSLRGEREAALAALDRALELGGPFDERIRVQRELLLADVPAAGAPTRRK